MIVRSHLSSSPPTFPERSPITKPILASNVWGRGRTRRSTPSLPATSTRFTSAARRRPQPIRTNTRTNCWMHTSMSKMQTRFMPSTPPKVWSSRVDLPTCHWHSREFMVKDCDGPLIRRSSFRKHSLRRTQADSKPLSSRSSLLSKCGASATCRRCAVRCHRRP